MRIVALHKDSGEASGRGRARRRRDGGEKEARRRRDGGEKEARRRREGGEKEGAEPQRKKR
jgi:hypothetical protein